jgi:hypothetical protein
MRLYSFPQRRHARLLRLLSHYSHDDRPLHRTTVHSIRVINKSHATASKRRIRPTHALHSRRFGGRIRSCSYHATGCDQNAITDARNFIRGGDQTCEGFVGRGGDNMAERRFTRVLQGYEC